MAGCRRGSNRYRRLAARLRARQAAEARRRRHALHLETTALIARARTIAVEKPAGSFTTLTASARGDRQRWGAMIRTKAMANRRILDFCPATFIQMLEYKARESGCVITVTENPAVKAHIPGRLVTAAKAVRAAKTISKQRPAKRKAST